MPPSWFAPLAIAASMLLAAWPATGQPEDERRPSPPAHPSPQASPPYAHPPPYPPYQPRYLPPPGYAGRPAAPPPPPPAWSPGEPAPPGYRVDSRVDTKLIVSGSLCLGLFWSASTIAASIGADAERDEIVDDGVREEDWYPLFAPVAGPFVAIATLNAEREGIAVLALDGVLQSLGFLGILIGVLDREEMLVRTSTLGVDVAAGAGSLTLRLRF